MKLNTFYLKVLALLIMTIDHIAVAFLPITGTAYVIMRMVGRISAPLFWFTFAFGYKHTHDKQKYKIRLLIAALAMTGINTFLSFVFPNLPFNFSPLHPNMFFSFLIMCVVIDIFELINKPHKFYQQVLVAIIAFFYAYLAARVIDYSWHIVLSILIFYFIPKQWLQLLLFIVSSIVICCIEQNFIQVFMIISAVFLANFDSKKPKQNAKWLFYIYYPLHIYLFALGAKLFL